MMGEEQEKKDGRGRPLFEPTDKMREVVEELAGLGLSHEDICATFEKTLGKSITPPTLRKHFRLQLNIGKAYARAKVSNTLFKMACSGENFQATRFYLTTQAGWKESPTEIAMTDADGNAIRPLSLADLYGVMAGEKKGADQADEDEDGGSAQK